MDNKLVRDLMVHLDDYGIIDQNASLLDAVPPSESSGGKRMLDIIQHRQPFSFKIHEWI